MWSEAEGNPALQEYYHRQANQIREHILVLGKTAPMSEAYLESVKRQLRSVDDGDSLKTSSDVGEDLLGVEEWKYHHINIAKIIGTFGANHEEEVTAVRIDLDKMIYLNGSKSGRVQNMSTQSPKSTGLVAAGLALSELISSFQSARTNFWATLKIQENGENKRAIIQIESNRNPLSIHAGQSYYHIDTKNFNEPIRVWAVKGLKDKLYSLGYEEYVSDYNVNIYNEVDAKRKFDLSHGYIGVDANGELILMPKLYANDKMFLVHNTEWLFISGICTGHVVDYDLSSDLRSKVSISDYGLMLLDNILDGDIVFEK